MNKELNIDNLGADVEEIINDSNWDVDNVTDIFISHAQRAAKSLNILNNIADDTEKLLNKTSNNLEERVAELENKLKEIQVTLKKEVINISESDKEMINSYTAALYISNTKTNQYMNALESYQKYINDDCEGQSTGKEIINSNTIVNNMNIEINCPISDSYSDLESRLIDEIRRQG